MQHCFQIPSRSAFARMLQSLLLLALTLFQAMGASSEVPRPCCFRIRMEVENGGAMQKPCCLRTLDNNTSCSHATSYPEWHWSAPGICPKTAGEAARMIDFVLSSYSLCNLDDKYGWCASSHRCQLVEETSCVADRATQVAPDEAAPRDSGRVLLQYDNETFTSRLRAWGSGNRCLMTLVVNMMIGTTLLLCQRYWQAITDDRRGLYQPIGYQRPVITAAIYDNFPL